MKLLLLAYEYPPIIAAQSLRWFYLSQGLASLGVEVHVLCPEFKTLPDYPVPSNFRIIEHRVWPGPFVGFSQWLLSKAGLPQTESMILNQPRKSVLVKIYRGMRGILDRVLYPDLRTEWYPFARRRVKQLLETEQIDLMISSHEPGVDLLLGLWAKKKYDLPWVVDLADPLCAPYSPWWRRWLDRRVERHILVKADCTLLTNDLLAHLLKERHHLGDIVNFVHLPQGAPTRIEARKHQNKWSRTGKMHIVYTGSFYHAFRNPQQFALALKALNTQDIALTVAGDNAHFISMFDGIPNVRFLGRLNHFECLDLQREADVLLNIGNTQPYQTPGKIYEYFAAGHLILHIRMNSEDVTEHILTDTGYGYVVGNNQQDIESVLRDLLDKWRSGRLTLESARIQSYAEKHSWASRSRTLYQTLVHVLSKSKEPRQY